MEVLVTGGAGYIGSHTCIELLNSGYEVIIIDNFINSSPNVLKRIKEITKKDFKFYNVDILDEIALNSVFKENNICAVLHFAGLKSVTESIIKPIEYHCNNVIGTLLLCKVMKKNKINKLVFSSSATVYGKNNPSPLHEDMPLEVLNPYGRTKMIIEQVLKDIYISDSSWGITILRYFNPVGAHYSGCIGEDPKGIPNNLMPYITQVALGKRGKLSIYGGDYDTYDGTGVRDYIHVVDLAKGHIKALEKVIHSTGIDVYNLGTGLGYSVLDIVKTFERVTGIKIPYEITERRVGDVAESYSNPNKAKKELGWIAEKNIEEMCLDAWRWQSNNPYGYTN